MLIEGRDQDSGVDHMLSEPRPSIVAAQKVSGSWVHKGRVTVDKPNQVAMAKRRDWQLEGAARGGTRRHFPGMDVTWPRVPVHSGETCTAVAGVRLAEQAALQRHDGLFLPEPEWNSITFEPLF